MTQVSFQSLAKSILHNHLTQVFISSLVESFLRNCLTQRFLHYFFPFLPWNHFSCEPFFVWTISFLKPFFQLINQSFIHTLSGIRHIIVLPKLCSNLVIFTSYFFFSVILFINIFIKVQFNSFHSSSSLGTTFLNL